MLRTAPTIMEECVQSLSQPQRMRNALNLQRQCEIKIKGYLLFFFYFFMFFLMCLKIELFSSFQQDSIHCE